MPANLPPQYFEIEQRYRREKSIPGKVAALQEMLAVMPKHKGTDHLKADLRAKIARLLQDLERPKVTSGGQPQPFSLRREGVGQAMLIGLANSGKSQLLATLTGASAKVGDYPFTTQIPQPGMLPFENVLIQLVDTPAINDREMQTRLFSLLRNADLLVIVIDLSQEPLAQVQELFGELEHWGYLLLGKGQAPDPLEPRVQKRAILVATKADEEGALDGFRQLEASYGQRFPTVMVSPLEEVGEEELKGAIFLALDQVRVYTKSPGGQPDLDEPIVLPRGSKLVDAAQSLHKDWRRRLKYALLWGSGKFDGQRVGREYVLADGDVIELHG